MHVESLEYVRTYRRMSWIKRRMSVIVDGKEGRVAGGCVGGNIAVKFPEWETVYYDGQGNVIADYREKKQ